LSEGPAGPNQKAYFVKFPLPLNFVVLIRVAFESGSLIRILDYDTDPYGSGSAILKITNYMFLQDNSLAAILNKKRNDSIAFFSR
jgi:hypothetical protein